MAKIRWIPLESNPDVMNKYIENLGVPEQVKFVDVYGLSADLLSMVPDKVLAVMLLYPITPKSEADIMGKEDNDNKEVYYAKQTIGNACGTMAIIHALANNQNNIEFDASKHLVKFLQATKDLSPQERGVYMETDTALGDSHHSSALEGQTEAPDADKKLDLHFIAFVEKTGQLYELDGRRKAPTNHGTTDPAQLLKDSCKVIQKFMDREPDNMNFSICALCKV